MNGGSLASSRRSRFALQRQLLLLFLGMGLRAADSVPSPSDLPPARYVIGLSPDLDRGVKDDVFRKIAGFVLEGMPVGSSLGIFDAYELRTVTTLTIPNAKAFHSGRTRINQFREELSLLKRFLAAEPSETNRWERPPAGSIRLPQFLDFIADAPATPGSPLVILMVGSPLYVDPREPSCSMAEGYFPSDGHLRASRDRTVFGVRDGNRTMSQAALLLGYFGDPWISEVHRERVQRFWSLYAAGRGCPLEVFSADLPTVFAALLRGGAGSEASSSRFRMDSSATKVEMIRITRDMGDAQWITRETLSGNPPPPPVSPIGPMKIGIRWTGDIDLDLYAASKSGAETLFFEHPRSPEGYYFKDHRSSPEREYEFIEFESPVDARRVNARINFFEGSRDRGPVGEVRIEFEGRIYAAPFALTAHRGNQGREGRSQTPCWFDIDVPSILGLRDPRRAAAE